VFEKDLKRPQWVRGTAHTRLKRESNIQGEKKRGSQRTEKKHEGQKGEDRISRRVEKGKKGLGGESAEPPQTKDGR